MPARKGHDTSRLKKAFLEAFRRSGNITLAARCVRVSRRSHYRWLSRDSGYGQAFEIARVEAADLLEDEARRRAVEGVEEPVGWYKGEPGGVVRRYSDTLLIFLMKALMPEVYGNRVDHGGAWSRIDISTLPDPLVSRIARGEDVRAVIASSASAVLEPGWNPEPPQGPGTPNPHNPHLKSPRSPASHRGSGRTQDQ